MYETKNNHDDDGLHIEEIHDDDDGDDGELVCWIGLLMHNNHRSLAWHRHPVHYEI